MKKIIRFVKGKLSYYRLPLEKRKEIMGLNKIVYKKHFEFPPLVLNGILHKYELNNKKVLDVGSGWGSALINFGEGSVGVELTKERIDFAHKIGLEMIEANIEKKLPFKDEEFDAVWASHIIEHLVSPYVTLNLFRKVLKDKGLLIITIPIISKNILHSLFRLKVKNDGWDAPMYSHAFSKDSIKFLIERCGFKIVDTGLFISKSNFINKTLSWLGVVTTGQITVIARKSNKVLRPQIFPPEEFEEVIYYDKEFVRRRQGTL
jgi:SAM-dependent methyltransferase